MSVDTAPLYIDYDDELWNNASRRAEEQPVFGNSHRESAANQVGCLGEVLVEHWLTLEQIAFSNETGCTTHDYRLASGATIDVKTKDRTVVPRPSYECSVPLYNHDFQRPNYYIFVSLLRDRAHTFKPDDLRRFTGGYIVGGIDIDRLDREGMTRRKGEVDAQNGTKFWTDCKNVYINRIDPPSAVLAFLQSSQLAPPNA